MSEEMVMIEHDADEVATLFNALDGVEVVVNRVLRAIPGMSEEQLEMVIIQAATMEKATFLIRGAATSEIQNRTIKLLGGRGKVDIHSAGVGAEVANLAYRVGKSAKTLETDARIFRAFGNKLSAEQEPFPREWYQEALGAGGKGDELLQIAYAKRGDPGYNFRQFRADKERLCGGDAAEELVCLHYVSVPLDDKEYAKVQAWSKKWGSRHGETVREMIRKHRDVKDA